MIRIIAMAVLALVAGVLALAASRPDSFRVQRSASIKAPPEKIFALVNDFSRWRAWSPYEQKVGKGRMEIAESSPPSRVVLSLDFSEPFEAHNVVAFTITPKGEATEVSWDMRGATPFLAKVVRLFSDMDRMVGTDFEAGLANLKALAEK